MLNAQEDNSADGVLLGVMKFGVDMLIVVDGLSAYHAPKAVALPDLPLNGIWDISAQPEAIPHRVVPPSDRDLLSAIHGPM
jgi:hypothetical protein